MLIGKQVNWQPLNLLPINILHFPPDKFGSSGKTSYIYKMNKHLEGKYIPYDEKIKRGLTHKMSHYTLCGELLDLKLKQFHELQPIRVTCPDCLKLIKAQKDEREIYLLEKKQKNKKLSKEERTELRALFLKNNPNSW